jgi:hypothetical protein
VETQPCGSGGAGNPARDVVWIDNVLLDALMIRSADGSLVPRKFDAAETVPATEPEDTGGDDYDALERELEEIAHILLSNEDKPGKIIGGSSSFRHTQSASWPYHFMQSARAGPGLLLQVAASPVFENDIVPPGHVTETSFSPEPQARLQPSPVSQASSLNA